MRPARGGMVVALSPRAGLRAAERGGLPLHLRRRGLLRAQRICCGAARSSRARYDLVAWLFLRGLGLIYLAAFVSLALQIRGLVGARRHPAARRISRRRARRLGHRRLLAPADAVLAECLRRRADGRRHRRHRARACWSPSASPSASRSSASFVLYLSFVYAGQMFFTYQWDMLLVEAGFLAIFLTAGSRIVVWLYRLLLFRFLFLAGLVKLASGDATWQQLTALDYHFWTQPLPSPLAYYAAQLPHWLLAAATAAALVIELVAVALIFLPRRPRMLAAALVIAFQIGIMLTGSYNWFNLLTVLLCLFLFDDQALRRVLPNGLAAAHHARGATTRPHRHGAGDDRRADRRADRREPRLRPARRTQLAHCRRHDRGAGAAAHRQSVRPLRHDDDDAARHRLRRLGRQSNLARVRAAVSPRAGDARADLEHPLSAAPRLAAVVRRLRQRRAAPLDRARCCSACSKAARTSLRSSRRTRSAHGRRSTCARCSTTIASRMRDRPKPSGNGGCAASTAPIIRRRRLPIFSRAAAPLGAGAGAGTLMSANQDRTRGTQLLETRSVSMIAVAGKLCIQ